MPIDPSVVTQDPKVEPLPEKPKALVYTDASLARDAQAELDVLLGYPRDGADIGGGIHAPTSQSRTMTATAVEKHPTLDQWALRLPAGAPAKDVALAVALDDTWDAKLVDVIEEPVK